MYVLVCTLTIYIFVLRGEGESRRENEIRKYTLLSRETNLETDTN